MSLGLRSLLALFALRPRARPVAMAAALEACAPGVDAEAAARIRQFIEPTKGPQPPVPFEIDEDRQPEGTYVRPGSADGDPDA